MGTYRLKPMTVDGFIYHRQLKYLYNFWFLRESKREDHLKYGDGNTVSRAKAYQLLRESECYEEATRPWLGIPETQPVIRADVAATSEHCDGRNFFGYGFEIAIPNHDSISAAYNWEQSRASSQFHKRSWRMAADAARCLLALVAGQDQIFVRPAAGNNTDMLRLEPRVGDEYPLDAWECPLLPREMTPEVPLSLAGISMPAPNLLRERVALARHLARVW